MATDEHLARTAAELAAAVTAFQEELGITAKLEERTSDTETHVRQNRRWIRLTVAGLLLDLSLTIFGAALFQRVNHNTRTVKRVQAVVSKDVLCPLYGIFLDSYHPEQQKPDARAAYEKSFAVIRAGNAKLGCQ